MTAMKKKQNRIRFLGALLAVLMTAACFCTEMHASAEQSDRVLGLWLSVNGEEHFLHQVTNGSMAIFLETDREDGTYPSVEIWHLKNMGKWTTFTEEPGKRLDYDDTMISIGYCPDLLSYCLRSGTKNYFSFQNKSSATYQITEVDGDIYCGMVTGCLGPYEIDGYFVLSTTADFSDTPEEELLGRIQGVINGVPFESDDSFYQESGGTTRNTCGVCGGNGKCHICGGKGRVYNSMYLVNRWETCSICGGNGRCNGCGGYGYHRW